MRHAWLFCVLTFAALLTHAGAAASAQPAAGGGNDVAVLTPFMDDATAGVAGIDVAGVNLDAVEPWLVELLKLMGMPKEESDKAVAEIRKNIPAAKQWVADFTQAGGKSVYIVVPMSARPTAWAVVPVGAGADQARLRELIKSPLGYALQTKRFEMAPDGKGVVEKGEAFQIASVKDSLVIGPPEAIAMVKAIDPAPRPELEKALAATAGSPLRVAFIPPEGLRGVVTLNMPKLPDELGGGSSAPLAHGLRWAAVGIDSPPKAQAKLTIQAKDAATAEKLRGIFDAGVKSLKTQKEFPAGPETDRIIATLTPKIAVDQLIITLDTNGVTQLAKDLAPAVAKARMQAMRMQSANNIRQMLLTVHMFASDNNDQTPAKLPDDVKKYLEGGDRLMVNPARPDKKPGYVYLAPGKKLSQVRNAADTVALYEAYDQFGEGVNVGFLDGHVEWISSEQEFKNLLAGKPRGKP